MPFHHRHRETFDFDLGVEHRLTSGRDMTPRHGMADIKPRAITRSWLIIVFVI
jgi:hypothetical protein